MLGRALTRVWIWAAAAEAYDHLGQPPLCHTRLRRRSALDNTPEALAAPIVGPPQVALLDLPEQPEPSCDEAAPVGAPEPAVGSEPADEGRSAP
jgi:hypothetical protein